MISRPEAPGLLDGIRELAGVTNRSRRAARSRSLGVTLIPSGRTSVVVVTDKAEAMPGSLVRGCPGITYAMRELSGAGSPPAPSGSLVRSGALGHTLRFYTAE